MQNIVINPNDIEAQNAQSITDLQHRPAVLLVAFNRPDLAIQTIDILRRARIKRIYVSVDGPRSQSDNDILKREAVLLEIAKIEWTNNVFIRDLPRNLGSYDHVPNAVDWFFEEESEGIILEDDCLPSMSFFKFCNNALDAYRECSEVMWINGYNGGFDGTSESFRWILSRYAISWGWATWRRAWQTVRAAVALGSEPVTVLGRLVAIKGGGRPIARAFWKQNILYAMNVPNWDLRALYAIWQCGGVAVSPPLNLVRNAGFGIEAVHGGRSDDPRGIVQAHEIDFTGNGTWRIGLIPPHSQALDAYLERVVYRISVWSVVRLWLATKFPIIRRIYRKVRGKRRI